MSESGVNGKYAPRPGNIPGVPVNLGGIVFVMAPLGLRLARELEKRGKAAKTEDDHYALSVDTAWESIKRNYPEVTRDEVEALLDTSNLQEAANAVMGQSGLKKVTPGELSPGSP